MGTALEPAVVDIDLDPVMLPEPPDTAPAATSGQVSMMGTVGRLIGGGGAGILSLLAVRFTGCIDLMDKFRTPGGFPIVGKSVTG